MAATCDRIYSNLVSPVRRAPPIPTPQHAKGNTNTAPDSRIHADFPDRLVGRVKGHRVTLDGIGVKELAWNADHTYSMSLKTLQKLGIVMEVPSDTQQKVEVAYLYQFDKDSHQRVDSDSHGESTILMEVHSEDSGENEKPLSPKSETIISSDDHHSQDDFVFLNPQESDQLEGYVKLEPQDVDETRALNETSVSSGEEGFPSKEQDVQSPETPLGNIAEVKPSHVFSDDYVAQPFHKAEDAGCVSSEENKTFIGNIIQPTASAAALKSNPVSPIETAWQTGGSNHEDENRGGIDDEVQRNQASGQDQEDIHVGDGESTSSSSDGSDEAAGKII